MTVVADRLVRSGGWLMKVPAITATFWIIKVLSTTIYQQTLILQNQPFGAALAVTLVLLVLGVLLVQSRLIERGRFRVVFR